MKTKLDTLYELLESLYGNVKVIVLVFFLSVIMVSCSRTYYANESWKAKSSRKELTIKPLKEKHTFKGNGSYW